MLYFYSPLTVKRTVKPDRKNLLLPRPPRLTSDSRHPFRAEVLKHLEEWSYQGQGDSFGDLTLRAGVLEHLEEWSDCDEGDSFPDPTDLVPGTDLTRTPVPTPTDRTHPLWDRELDG
jgi:hypothetical protein